MPGDRGPNTVGINPPRKSTIHLYSIELNPNSTKGMAWAMPIQPLCNESSWVYLGSASEAEGDEGDCGDDQDDFSCLWLQFSIVPFQVGLTGKQIQT